LGKLIANFAAYFGKYGTSGSSDCFLLIEYCGICAALVPLAAGSVFAPTPFISSKFHIETMAVAEQKLSPSLVHGQRGRLFHIIP
jgi:hypothetical protein